MGTHYLERFFQPRSIAVIGASETPGSVGAQVLDNLVDGSFRGTILPVNPHHRRVRELPCVSRVQALAETPDLAVICVPPRAIHQVVEDCGRKGVRAALILAAGLGEPGTGVKRVEQSVMMTARRHGIRIIGPDWVGLMRPHLGLNATFSRSHALPGQLALVSQSGALTSAVLDWADSRRIGFSAVCSLGDTTDVDYGDVLDYLALDPDTRSILLYVETITDARRFMSGLRAAARLKPVIVMKVGRQQASHRATSSHTGALVGADDAFDAALGRAGAVRVPTVGQLFAAAELLAAGRRLRGDRIAVITNGGGPGIIATDLIAERELQLSELSAATLDTLNEHLPARWPGDNPVDILGDADAERFRNSVSTCLADQGVDGALVILTPQARTEPEATAQALCELDTRRKPVLACWMGGTRIRSAREQFTSAGFPNFATPENAAEALSALSRYRRSQSLLMQVPDASSARSEPDMATAQGIIDAALAAGQTRLTPWQSKSILEAFEIPVSTTVVARSAAEARAAAERLGLPVAVKINSPAITHKRAVDGVRLNVLSGDAVEQAYADILAAVRRARPDVEPDGVSVEPMHTPRHGHEVMLGVVRDPVFGPVISFGSGGSMVEVIRDRAVSLPPLNDFLARDLMVRTRVGRHLRLSEDSRLRREFEHALLRLSDLVCSLPRVTDVDINPVIADPDSGVIAVDARVHIRDSVGDGYSHMAIMPYPRHLTRTETLPDGTRVLLRPIRPEDAAMEEAFIEGLSARSRYYRFMDHMGQVTLPMLVRFTQIDYHREMALVAVDESGQETRQVGVARYVVNPDGRSCEFAIAVADDWQGKGLGRRLMERLMETARDHGLERIEGQVLSANRGMLRLMERLGFSRQRVPGDYSVMQVERALEGHERPAQDYP
ncbi:bifunctional acetate--CoA ligase family protein/GNAT family N-acetyltransferase [Aquisalimonas sp. 2447]|uniref:bifunctional acetate--CoA ligase family protein/GNAT family N-acetyltransferase n=1 Tax=Aquisalimonas sp. 2447 TaxID=2740807 RepID=UPI0014326FC1|nr:bifunctional acetate--CoA ligase family protein/GNAT family N-acetyltransferase [Aquisalimonas sp. 2447]QIT56670.1 bifunctional acetate--CoA ligase family protein/GNAT family N-acetyltransferase [Aquisalimonas sp. 2447]